MKPSLRILELSKYTIDDNGNEVTGYDIPEGILRYLDEQYEQEQSELQKLVQVPSMLPNIVNESSAIQPKNKWQRRYND